MLVCDCYRRSSPPPPLLGTDLRPWFEPYAYCKITSDLVRGRIVLIYRLAIYMRVTKSPTDKLRTSLIRSASAKSNRSIYRKFLDWISSFLKWVVDNSVTPPCRLQTDTRSNPWQTDSSPLWILSLLEKSGHLHRCERGKQ